MSQTNTVRFKNNLVNAKQKKLNVVKIVDAAKTAQDLLPYPNPVTGLENPGQARTIYKSVYMTFGSTYMTSAPLDGNIIDIPIYETIHPINDIRTWGDHTNQNINNLNAVLELPGGSNLKYSKDHNEDNGKFTPYDTYPGATPDTLSDLGYHPINGTPTYAPAQGSFGFLPRTLMDTTYNFNMADSFAPSETWMTGLPAEVNGEPYYNPAETYYGDGDALDVIVAGQKPDGNGNFVLRDILEIVKVRVIAVAVGIDVKPGLQPMYEAYCIGISNDDPRFEGINTIAEWQAAAASNPFLNLTLFILITILKSRTGNSNFNESSFKGPEYADKLIKFVHSKYLQQE